MSRQNAFQICIGKRDFIMDSRLVLAKTGALATHQLDALESNKGDCARESAYVATSAFAASHAMPSD